ncbi:MAG: transposase domain-containing protein [Candidatus Dadabacteria bacterium]|nr:MAG: transposase domain-containing protein [Candidatus Dadabacteria bacterium]
MNGINPLEYYNDVLTRLDIASAKELTPPNRLASKNS